MTRLAVIFAACVGLVAIPAFAQQALSGDEIKALVTGKIIETSGGIISYKADGKYEYYGKSNGATFRGKWSIRGDQVCVDFDAGDKRCDRYVKDGSRISLKNSQGALFPVTAVK